MVSKKRARAGNRDLQLRHECRRHDCAARGALDRAPSRMAVCISIHGRIQCDLDRLLADHLSSSAGRQEDFIVGTRTYSERPAGALGKDRMVAPSHLPSNLDVCDGEVPYRSNLVVLSVLAAEISLDRSRRLAARIGP